MLRPLERPSARVLSALDAFANRCYGWRYNPLYQSGTIVVALYLTMVVTGLWLILFYRVGAPWESVAGLTSRLWIGNWVRGLHRYASDAAVVATLVHAFRMFAQGRSWGARSLAWVSGGVLLVLLMLCGWTGYVMVWDTFGEYLAREGARMLDTLPVLSEPTSRAFTGERPVPSVFFFVTLFAHIGMPLGAGVVFWLHIKRLARPAMLPPKPLMWTTIGVLTAVAVVRPLVMAPRADAFVIPADIPADLFFAFWIPLTRRLSGGTALAGAAVATMGLLVVPWFTRRRGTAAPAPSFVDEDVCVGCEQCALDCPYGAIEMIPRPDPSAPPADRVAVRRAVPDVVAHVDPHLCVSCGICAGSCAPMGVGPAGRTGRDQLGDVQRFLAAPERCAGEVVVVGCTHGAGRLDARIRAEGAALYPLACAGALHTSVIEWLLRGGAGGVMVLACPPRDCWNREGPRWLNERVYHEREAELQARVDRARVRLAYANASEGEAAIAEVRRFMADVARLDVPIAALPDPSEPYCEPVEQGRAS